MEKYRVAIDKGASAEEVEGIKAEEQVAKDPLKCLVCHEKIRLETYVYQLPCHKTHIYHIKCFDDWSIKRQPGNKLNQLPGKCPKCKVLPNARKIQQGPNKGRSILQGFEPFMPQQEFVDQVMNQSNIADGYNKIELVESMFMQVVNDLSESKLLLTEDMSRFKQQIAGSALNHYSKEHLIG